MENWGRGIGLMVSECRRVGIPDPEFHTDGNSVWVIIIVHAPTVTPQVEKVMSAVGFRIFQFRLLFVSSSCKVK